MADTRWWEFLGHWRCLPGAETLTVMRLATSGHDKSIYGRSTDRSMRGLITEALRCHPTTTTTIDTDAFYSNKLLALKERANHGA